MCVQSEADYRPLMTDVVQSLIPLVKQQTGSRVTSSPNFCHHIVTIKSSSIDSGSSGTSLNSNFSEQCLRTDPFGAFCQPQCDLCKPSSFANPPLPPSPLRALSPAALSSSALSYCSRDEELPIDHSSADKGQKPLPFPF